MDDLVVVDRGEVDRVVPDGVADVLLVGCFELIIPSSPADVVFSEVVISVVSGRVTTVVGSGDTQIASNISCGEKEDCLDCKNRCIYTINILFKANAVKRLHFD